MDGHDRTHNAADNGNRCVRGASEFPECDLASPPKVIVIWITVTDAGIL